VTLSHKVGQDPQRIVCLAFSCPVTKLTMGRKLTLQGRCLLRARQGLLTTAPLNHGCSHLQLKDRLSDSYPFNKVHPRPRWVPVLHSSTLNQSPPSKPRTRTLDNTSSGSTPLAGSHPRMTGTLPKGFAPQCRKRRRQANIVSINKTTTRILSHNSVLRPLALSALRPLDLASNPQLRLSSPRIWTRTLSITTACLTAGCQ
jgi:hypothetical protein